MIWKERAAFIFAAVILGGIGFSAWRNGLENRTRMEQTIQDMRRNFDASAQAMKQNHDDLQNRLSDIQRQASLVRTPAQAAAAIPQVIPGVQPIIVQVPASPLPVSLHDHETGNPQAGQPPAPGIQQLPLKAEIPADQLKILYDFAQTCHETELKFTACQSDKIEMIKQMQALETERNAAIKAAKGGSLAHRFLHDLKLTGIAIGIGFGAGYAVSHR